MRRFTIAIIGSASGLTKKDRMEVEKLSQFLAIEGCDLVTGGMGGVMRAVARGHYRSNSCSSLIHLTPGWETRGIINPYPSSNVQTKMGEMRNTLVVRSADAVIAISGGAGTLSEIALAWQNGLPVASYGTMGGWSEKLAGKSLDHRRDDVLIQLNSIVEVGSWLTSISEKGAYYFRTGNEIYPSQIPLLTSQIQSDHSNLKSALDLFESNVVDYSKRCSAYVFIEIFEGIEETIEIVNKYSNLRPIVLEEINSEDLMEFIDDRLVQKAIYVRKDNFSKDIQSKLELLEDKGGLPWIVHDSKETLFNDKEVKSMGITQQFLLGMDKMDRKTSSEFNIVTRW
tara:strand:- start:222 stop:1244 length:1023 start_codon:yes stop_codon:yes gene_type:complete